jgi:uncharacterized protein (TIGR03437 family)
MRRILLALVLSVIPISAQPGPVAYRIGGPGIDYGKDITVDAEGNSYIAAYFSGTVDMDPGPGEAIHTSAGGVDNLLIQFDPQGRYVRSFRFGGPGMEIPHGIARDTSGNLILAGYFQQTADFDPGPRTVSFTSAGARDVYVAKFSPEGQLLWATAFGGAAGDDEAMDVTTAPDGSVYVAGIFRGEFSVGQASVRLQSNGGVDNFVAKFDAEGRPQWAFALGGPGDDYGTGGLGIATDGMEAVVVYGSFRDTMDADAGSGERRLSSAGQLDFWVARYRLDGTHDWSFSMGGPGNENATPGGLTVDRNGFVLLTGHFQASIDADPGEGMRRLISAGASDIVLARYTPQGTLRWAFSIGSAGADGGHKVAVDGAGYVGLTGWIAGALDMDPGPGNTTLTARGANGALDAFVARYREEDGSLVWAHAFGPATSDGESVTLGGGLGFDASGRMVATGRFHGTVAVGSGAAASSLTSAGENDIYLLRYDRAGRLTPSGSTLGSLNVAAVVSAGGMVRQAAPGGLAALYGTFPVAQPEGFTAFPVPLSLCGLSVSMRESTGIERPAPILYCSSTQINVQIPYALQPGPVDVTVQERTGSDSLEIALASASPSVFAVVFGAGERAGQRVTSVNPARAGDVLSIYATGLGLVDGPMMDGIANSGLVRIVTPIAAEWDGISAQVDFAGLAPGLAAGVYQVNVTVPAGTGVRTLRLVSMLQRSEEVAIPMAP